MSELVLEAPETSVVSSNRTEALRKYLQGVRDLPLKGQINVMNKVLLREAPANPSGWNKASEVAIDGLSWIVLGSRGIHSPVQRFDSNR